MDPDAEPAGGRIPLELSFRVRDRELHLRAEVPSGPVTVAQVLPVLRALTDGLVDARVRDRAAEGATLSCRQGCGACCSQMVPVSRGEALRLWQLVEEMEPERRERVLEGFRRVRWALERAGLDERFDALGQGESRAERNEVAWEYTRLDTPCPFLEDQSCSIYEERPLACREYVVTSDPVHCRELVLGLLDPDGDEVDRIELGPLPSVALQGWEGDRREGDPEVLPLTRALDWVEASGVADDPPRAGAREILSDVIDRLFGTQHG